MSILRQQRSLAHQPHFASYAFTLFAVTLVLLYAGGFTTTIGAGMVFLDWPLSNGSINPPGWTTDEAMLAEHSHRLLGFMTGMLSIGLVVWAHLREERRWMRWMCFAVLGFVIFQGVLGGMRVLFDSLNLANVHGVTAQLFLCIVVAVSAATARWWWEVPTALEGEAAKSWRQQRAWGVALCVLIVAQLVIGSIVRHRGAGMAIPHFPASTAEGGLLPAVWSWPVTIHFLHRVMAVAITLVLIPWAISVLRSALATPMMKRFAVTSLVLLVFQIALGASIIWTVRQPFETTLHVLNGALLLSACWVTTFAYFRSLFAEERAMAAQAAGDPSAATATNAAETPTIRRPRLGSLGGASAQEISS